MRKILVLSLLFALFAVPASAQTEEDAIRFERFFVYAIQSFDWKCNEMQNFDYGSIQVGTIAIPASYKVDKITCEDDLTYYVRETGKAHTNDILYTFCHKGVCKKFQ